LSEDLTNFFAKAEIEAIARETGFVQRASPINGSNFLDILLFTKFDHQKLSLTELAVELFTHHGVLIRKQSLDGRFNEYAVKFLRVLLKQLLQKVIGQKYSLSFLQEFKSVRIKDSTSFQLPEIMADLYAGSGGSGSKAAIRIQFEYDFKTGEIIELSLHPFNKQDHTNAAETIGSVEENDLIIRDLGYTAIECSLEIIQRKAFFLNRHNFCSNAYENKEDKNPMDFGKIQDSMKKHNLSRIEKKDVYIGTDKRLKVRMIIELLPEQLCESRLRKANENAQKKGRKLSDEHKAHICLNVYITNIPAEMLDNENVRTLYRLRWQVELVFKIWKSIGEIHKTKEVKIHRFETMLYAKLIWIVLNWVILWQLTGYFWCERQIYLSPIKSFNTFKNISKKFQRAISIGYSAILDYILNLIFLSPEYHVLERRKNQLSSLEIMLILSV